MKPTNRTQKIITTFLLFSGISIFHAGNLLLSQPLPSKKPAVFSCKTQLDAAITTIYKAIDGLQAVQDSADDRSVCLDNMDWVFFLAMDYFGSWDRYHPDREFCRALELGFAVERGETCKYRFGINTETGETGCKLISAATDYRITCPFLDFNQLGSDYNCCIQWNVIQHLLREVQAVRSLAQALWGGYQQMRCAGRDERREDHFRNMERFYGEALQSVQTRAGFSDFSGKCKLLDLDKIEPEKKPCPDMIEAGIE